MSQYRYSSLLPGLDSIRLLRLMPHKDETAPIQCELFEYSLQESGNATHPYEALSYVWGGSDKPQSIFIDNQYLAVTLNLHAALLRLRDRGIARIIWVDAVCINQADEQEKEHQIQSMAKIYGQANRVIVWLGEAADQSDRAFEAILVAADEKSTNSSNNETIQQPILAVLQRPWFRRIWVLQEVAAARHVLIMCGSTEIDGHAFCLGLKSLNLPYEAYPDLHSLIRSVAYLIRGAIFRPRCATRCAGKVSLNIRSLGELVDMYHTHEATEHRDKVYALLGMSSDDPSAAGLSPDYKVSWERLFQRLVKFLLCKEVSVETWGDREMAVIKSKGCIIGQVSSVKGDIAWDDRQNVEITFKNTPAYLEYEGEWSARWTLQTTAKSIRQGDLICLLQGASKPAIIRLCKDYFTIITIAAAPIEDIQTESAHIKWSEPLQSIQAFPRDFLLVWDWAKFLGKLQDQGEYETLTKTNSRMLEHLKTEWEDHLNTATRLWNVALILGDLEEYKEAEERLREAIGGCERAVGKEHPHTLTGIDSLALMYKKKHYWKKAEELFVQVIQTRKQVQGADHLDTLRSMANLASMYRDQGHLKEAEKLEMMIHLLERREDNSQITQEEVIKIARSFDKEVMTLLLERRGDDVQITEGVIKAAAGNSRSGKEVMTLLLERRGDDVQITEGVVKSAAGNSRSGKEVMTLLLERRGDDVQITEGVIKSAAGNSRSGKEVMTLLLERRGDDAQITEGAIMAAAGNRWSGEEVMTLLLERGGDDVGSQKEWTPELKSDRGFLPSSDGIGLDWSGFELKSTPSS